jgi:subtilisin family serine protease
MISRGNIDFTDKVRNVMLQGAKAAIIANNDQAAPDSVPTLVLAAGTWIPTVSMSYASGVAIRANGLGNGSVSVTLGNYTRFDGTSMATPYASGVAALAWSAKPTLTNATIRSVMQSKARDLGPAGKDVYVGYGLVQADATIAEAMNRR